MDRKYQQDIDSYESKQNQQRASMKWLLSKAYNNNVPENLKEPFYRNMDGQEHLKPQIVVGLGNAMLYCQTLTNLYSDPNYQSLNHWSILQTLTRKGVPVGDLSDTSLTETVLIQTNPLRINAHMSVIEALMILYAKEITASERIAYSGIRKNDNSKLPKESQYHETALLSWVTHICNALIKRIMDDIENGFVDENVSSVHTPTLPQLRDYQDLCDGVCLAFLISYYCPKLLPWPAVRVKNLPTVEDSIYNVLLVSNFCQNYLPYSVFHLTSEDVAYMRGSMKLNLVVLLADFFNLFEIHPAKCVCYPEMNIQQHATVTQSVSPSPSSARAKQTSRDSAEQYSDDGFVVHRGRAIPTLTSIQEPLIPARLRQSKEKTNIDTKAEERGDNMAAGRPSNWEDSRRSSFAGRRSRRNSLSEDSQLTIENFGGSQDQLNMFGLTPDKDSKSSTPNVNTKPAVAVRSSLADARGTFQIGYEIDGEAEKQDYETEKRLSRQHSVENLSTNKNSHFEGRNSNYGDITYYQNANKSNTSVDDAAPKQKTSFATLPNTTTWQQQSSNYHPLEIDAEIDRPSVDASKLSTIRLKLEEKRRHIEQEKRRMEMAMNKQQQQVGKAAFLQAINKSKVPSENDGKDAVDSNSFIGKNIKSCSLKNLVDMENKIDGDNNKNSDLEQIDFEQYQQTIAIMNNNLKDIQQDIHRLTNQQSHMQAQHIQAQQLLQAQQIANMINQCGLQQYIPVQYRPMAQNFGSSPHLAPQQFSSPSAPAAPTASTSSITSNNYNKSSTHNRDTSQHTPPMQFAVGSQISHPNSRECSPFTLVEPGQSSGGSSGSTGAKQYPDANQYHSYRVNDQPYDDYGVSPPNQFYLHENPPQASTRRTWAQSATNSTQLPFDFKSVAQVHGASDGDITTWNQISNQIGDVEGGFMLHQNGNEYDDRCEQSHSNLFPVHRQLSHLMMGGNKENLNNGFENSECIDGKNRRMDIIQMDDEMAPQSISFIGDEEDVADKHNNSRSGTQYQTSDNRSDIDLSKLNITSGNLTYRIPSPSRHSLLNMNSFQNPNENNANNSQRGFYIAFDDQPKRPKPPLRAKRSPQKEMIVDSRQEIPNKLEQKTQMQALQKNRQNDSLPIRDGTANTSSDESMLSCKHFKLTESKPQPSVRKYVNDNHQMASIMDRRHLEDVTNHPKTSLTNTDKSPMEKKTLIIDNELKNLDPGSVDEMERKKEKIMLLSLQRRQQQEEAKARKEIETIQRREKEREKEDERARKREEQAARRAAILEQHKFKKAIEEAEQKGLTIDRNELMMMKQQISPAATKMRSQKIIRPRPKTIHIETGSVDLSEISSLSSRNKKGSNSNLTGIGSTSSNSSIRRDYYRGSQDSLPLRETSTSTTTSATNSTSTAGTAERGRTLSRISVAKGSNLNFRGRKSNSLMNLCDTDSGLGRATPPRRAPSPGMGPTGRHLPSPSGPGSLPPGFMNKRRIFDDGSSDISSAASSMLEYSGPKLYKQPTTKSNRGIILNAVEYCVFPGVVNRDAKQKVLEKISRSEAKHFLILFRDAGCQFRALYGYWPDNETVLKLYGTGPSQVDEFMFDKFFKYNSGGKCFSQVHTKHLTVTIDAFTIHNSLWQGKKINIPSKKDMALVI